MLRIYLLGLGAACCALSGCLMATTFSAAVQYTLQTSTTTSHPQLAQFHLAELTPSGFCTAQNGQLNTDGIDFVVAKSPTTRDQVTGSDGAQVSYGLLFAGVDGRIYYNPESSSSDSPIVQSSFYPVGTHNVQSLQDLKPGTVAMVQLDPQIGLLLRGVPMAAGASTLHCFSTLTTAAAPLAVANPPLYAMPDMTPKVGRKYTYNVAGPAIATQVYEVTDASADSVTFDFTLNTATASPVVQRGLKTQKTHGIYWTSNTPNPVTADIATYAEEGVALPYGTFFTRKVIGTDGSTSWFSQGLPVKYTLGATTTQLVNVQ
jgi:hypothetical protein